MLAETLGEFQIAALQRLGVDLKGVDPAVEVAVQAEYETGVDVHGAVGGQLDVAPVHAADPVQLIDLGIGLHVQVCRQLEAAIDQGAVDGRRVGTAAPGQEIEDSVVGLERSKPRSAHSAAFRRFVGDPAQEVDRIALVLMQAHRIGYEGDRAALFALVVVPVGRKNVIRWHFRAPTTGDLTVA